MLELATELNHLGFAFDDAHVDDPRPRSCAGLAPVVGALVAVLDAPEMPVEDRYERALHDVFLRLGAATTPGSALQIAEGLRKS
ncbi:hypothetical protein ACFVFS_14080 [Kitasatospora sp. NPDC057692]|uniref:hypothetical protein n=1 Tax=Kitasatospora sp. NPDC057692 TaxID=3346215 RepID=UPI00368B8DEC